MKRFLSMLLVVTIILSTVLITVPVITAADDGTNAELESQGYIGITALNQITTGGGKYYLKNDVSVTSMQSIASGSNADNLTTLDGNGHTITLNNSNYGLYGWAKNVHFKNFTLAGSYSCTNDDWAGPAALTQGIEGKLVVENVVCTVDQTIGGSHDAGAGGIVGKQSDNGSVIIMNNVVNKGNITFNGSTNAIGGIVAWSQATDNGLTLNNCRFEGTITATSARAISVGGILGGSSKKQNGITNCVNTGTITASCTSGTASIGGIVGGAGESIKISNCESAGNIMVGSNGNVSNIGGILGNICHKDGSAIDSAVVENCISGTTITAADNKATAGNFAGMIGKSYKVSSVTIKNCVNEGDITLTKTTAQQSGVAGMIGYADNRDMSTAKIYLENCLNTGNISTDSGVVDCCYVGGMTGRLIVPHLSVKNCVNYGDISSKATTGWRGTAGMTPNIMSVGSGNFWTHLDGGDYDFINCHNYGDVTGYAAAGIFSNTRQIYAPTTVDISYCTNNGTVQADTWGGGIVGYIGEANNDQADETFTLNIANCVNNGTVKANWEPGGILGNTCAELSSLTVNITSCANTAAIIDIQDANGGQICGKCEAVAPVVSNCASAGTSENVISTATLSEASTGNVSGEGAAEAAAAIEAAIYSYAATNKTNLVFDDATLKALTSGNNVYILEDFTTSGGVTGDFYGAVYGLNNTITLNNSTGLFVIAHDITIKDLNLAGTVVNNTTHASSLALDGFYGTNLIENVHSTATVTTTGNVGAVGGLLSKAEGKAVTFRNCSYSGTITVGEGTVTSHGGVGGIIGQFGSATGIVIENCTTAGTITVNAGQKVGGIAGQINTTAVITNCTNNADITAKSYTGGIIADVNNASVTVANCVNNGDVSGQYVGGIWAVANVGAANELTIENVINNGDITGQNFTGGISCWIKGTSQLKISKAVNTGTVKVTGNKYVAGILGTFASSDTSKRANIDSCVNAGSVISPHVAGRGGDVYVQANGILGAYDANKILITNCVHMGTIATNNGASNLGAMPIANAIETVSNGGDYDGSDNGFFESIFLYGDYTTFASLGNVYLEGTATLTSSVIYNSPTTNNPYKLSIKVTYAQLADKLEAMGIFGFSTKDIDAAIAEKGTLAEGDYFATEWAAYTAAVTAAQSVLDTYNKADEWTRKQYVLADEVVKVNAAKDALVNKADYYESKGVTEAISDAEALTNAEGKTYTEATWSVLQTALTNMKNAVNNANRDENELNSFKQALIDATNGVETFAEYYERLDLTGAMDISALTETDYTQASWTVLANAIAAAQTKIDGYVQDDAEILAAKQAIEDAKAALVAVKPIDDAIASIPENTNGNTYTAKSWAAIQNAKTTLQGLRSTATEVDEVTSAIGVLNDTIKAANDEKTAVEALKTAIANAEAVVLAGNDDGEGGKLYTDTSWTALVNKIAEVKAVFTDATLNYDLAAYKTAVETASTVIEGGLVPSNFKVQYQNAIKEATDADRKAEDYTKLTFDAFTTALDKLEADYESIASLDDASLEKTLNDYNKALKALVYIKDIKAYIAGIELEDEGYYTEGTYSAYEEALAAAQAAIADDSNATQNDVDNYLDALAGAVEELTLKTVDNKEFNSAKAEIEDVKNSYQYDSKYYSEDTWAELEAAVKALEALDETATQLDFDKAYARYEKAVAELVYEAPDEADNAALAALIAKAEAINGAIYYDTTVEALADALAYAKELAEDENAVKVEIAGAILDLEAALAGLVKLPPEESIYDTIRAEYATLNDADKISAQMLAYRGIDAETLLELIRRLKADDVA